VDLLFVPLDEVDKIDVLLEDDLWSQMKKNRSVKQGNQMAHKQVATHGATSLKCFRNRVNLQDTTELLPVIDVFLIGPIEVVKFLLYGDVEHVPRHLLLWVVLSPLGLLAQTIEFGNGRVRRLRLELGVLREKTFQWCFNA